jgi:hypothetical protein
MQVLSADDWPQLLYRLCIPLSQVLSQLLQLGAPAAPWLGRGCVLRMQPRILLSSINSDECGRGEIAHRFGGSMVLGEEQHITRSPAACAKIGQNPSAVSGIRRGPSGDLRRELVWMLGKPPRLTALLAQLLSTRRRDGVRVNPLGRMAGLGCVEISTRLTRAKSQHRCMAGKFSAITLGRRGGGTHLLPSLPLRTLEVEGRSHGGVRRVPACW